jgi:hypothetical protein
LPFAARHPRDPSDLLGRPDPQEVTMPNAGLALILALASTPAAPGQANELTLAHPRLEQRIAERGPIRLQLEAALSTSAMEIAAHALDGSSKESPNASSGSHGHAWACLLGALAILIAGFFFLVVTNDSWF